MRWLLPANTTLNPSTLPRIPFVPHIPLPELVSRIALCHFPSMHSHCPSPATVPSALLATPAGLTLLCFTAWSPCSLSLPWYHPTVSTGGCYLPPSNPGILPASLLWSLLIFTLYFSNLCALLLTFLASWLQRWSISSFCLSQWLAHVRRTSTCIEERNGHNFRPEFTSLCRALRGTEDRGHW